MWGMMLTPWQPWETKQSYSQKAQYPLHPGGIYLEGGRAHAPCIFHHAPRENRFWLNAGFGDARSRQITRESSPSCVSHSRLSLSGSMDSNEAKTRNSKAVARHFWLSRCRGCHTKLQTQCWLWKLATLGAACSGNITLNPKP